MDDKTWEKHRSTFEKRGVSRGVADRRPYVRYERGDRHVTDELFSSIPQRQRGATVTRRVNYSGGWLMPRYRVSRTLPPVLPEFGPADELEERIETHDHTWPSGWTKHIHGRGHDDVNVDGTHQHDWLAEPHRHDSVDPRVWSRHVSGLRSGHDGVDPGKVHEHARSKKYLFAPKPYVWTPIMQVDHTHGERGQRKWHGRDTDPGEHQHVAWIKSSVTAAQRLDMHPDTTREVLTAARRVFFVIEGVLKNDALVTAGEAVFNVPSVWQWDAPELEGFARSFLVGKHVYIVPDSDWAENPEVSLAAFAARAALGRVLGHRNVDVAAPTPEPAFCPLHEEMVGAKRGVDDYLADRESPDDLVVLGRSQSRQMREWCRRYEETPRGGLNERGRRTAAQVLQALAMLADQNGKVSRREQSIARFLGWSGKRAYERVRRAVDSLTWEFDERDPDPGTWDVGLLDSPLEAIWPGERNWKGEWDRAPIIVLRKDLRTREHQRRVGDR
jgi:hypothetical protein